MQKSDLEQYIHPSLMEEFDSLILTEFCSKPGLGIKSLEVSNRHGFASTGPEVSRRWKIDLQQSVTFSKGVGEGALEMPAQITITGTGLGPVKGPKWFSFTDLCAIFFPQDRFESTRDWRKTLRANIQVLSHDLVNLYEKDIAVAISGPDPREKASLFWEKEGVGFRQEFYAQAYPLLKLIVEKAVPEITLAARWGSDSPYQRFKDPEKWALLSFRYNKRQQVDIVQYLEAKKIRFKCALIDLGFLENGYGKVAKIKEVLSMEVEAQSAENSARVQKDFLARVLKELPSLLKS